mmetsp:Transcript_8047/g.14547  ORF Transcript_8047/g.14547 Transcript_8047/m.14547 type:complete len:270 (+) Transcript_8047:1767-2576(+)
MCPDKVTIYNQTPPSILDPAKSSRIQIYEFFVINEKFFSSSNIARCIVAKPTRVPLNSLTLWGTTTTEVCFDAIPVGTIQKVTFIKGNEYRSTYPNVIVIFILGRYILHPTPFDDIAGSLPRQKHYKLTPGMPHLEESSAAVAPVNDQTSFLYGLCCKYASTFAWTCISDLTRYNYGITNFWRFFNSNVAAVHVICWRINSVQSFHIFFVDSCPLFSKLLDLEVRHWISMLGIAFILDVFLVVVKIISIIIMVLVVPGMNSLVLICRVT